MAGLAVSTVYQYVLSSPPPEMQTNVMIGMNIAIWVIAISFG